MLLSGSEDEMVDGESSDVDEENGEDAKSTESQGEEETGEADGMASENGLEASTEIEDASDLEDFMGEFGQHSNTHQENFFHAPRAPEPLGRSGSSGSTSPCGGSSPRELPSECRVPLQSYM
jgi:hypothetical protein